MPKVELNLEDDELKELLLGDRDKAMQSIMTKILDEILKSEATEQIKAKAYERSDERTNSWHGYRVRQLTTRVGSLELHVPKLRHGNFSTQLFKRYQRSEQAFDLALMEMVIQGVSTRKVAEITKKLCGTTFSKSTVSALCNNLDDQVLDFNRRPLTQKYAFVYADAILFKVHRGHVVTSNSLLVAIGIDPSGRREVLGFDIGDSESKAAWMDFFSELKQRGLTNVDMFVSDAHCGLKDAITTQFQGSLWQRCQFHFSNACTSILALKEREYQFETPKWLGIDEIHIIRRPRLVLTNIERRTIYDIKPTNIDGVTRKVTRNTYIYKSSTGRTSFNGKWKLYKGETVTTYGGSYKFKNGKRYFRIGGPQKQYVKASNLGPVVGSNTPQASGKATVNYVKETTITVHSRSSYRKSAPIFTIDANNNATFVRRVPNGIKFTADRFEYGDRADAVADKIGSFNGNQAIYHIKGTNYWIYSIDVDAAGLMQEQLHKSN